MARYSRPIFYNWIPTYNNVVKRKSKNKEQKPNGNSLITEITFRYFDNHGYTFEY